MRHLDGSEGSALKDAYLDAKGVRVHYVEAGAGRLILFLHGFPEFWYEWRKQLIEFGKDNHAVALDLPGYNLSGKPSQLADYRAERIVEVLRKFAHRLSPDRKFVLVGHDWGGFLAWVFAIGQARALEKLVIFNAPHPAIFVRLLESDPAQQKASEYMKMFRSAEAEQILSANNYEVLASRVMAFGRKDGLALEDKPEYIKAWAQPGALSGGLNCYRANTLASRPADSSAAAASLMVHVPTLVIWGDTDPALLPQNLDGLEEYVPRLTIHRIPDASHWLVHTHSAEVNSLMRTFVR